jgi:phosphate/sulfate permease
MNRDLMFLTWSEKTWRERGQTALSWIVATIVGAAISGAILWGIFESLDGLGRNQSEYNRCLQHATNGYEIKQCQ